MSLVVPPFAPPSFAADLLGSTSVQPFVLVVDGQSNAQGSSNEGDHAVGPNIWITNDKNAPTAVIPAAYGTAPLNQGPGGATATAAQCYNNMGVAFANALRASGLIPASRPIVVVPSWEPAQAIVNWTRCTSFVGSIAGTVLTVTAVIGPTPIAAGWLLNVGAGLTPGAVSITGQTGGTPGGAGTYALSASPGTIASETMTAGYDAYAIIDMRARLARQLAAVQAAYPGAVINHLIRAQGENDSGGSTSFGSRVLYGAEWATLYANLHALPMWGANTTISVQELATWANNTSGQARNDFLRTLAEGSTYPDVTMVSSAGLTETTIAANLGPHFDGPSLNLAGRRHFQAWRTGVLGRQFGSGSRTTYGSALAFPNNLTVAATGTSGSPAPINVDDIRSGARITLTGGYAQLPNPGNHLSYPLRLYGSTQTILSSQGAMFVANTAGTQTVVTIGGGERWEASNDDGASWRLRRVSPTLGDAQRNPGKAALSGTVAFSNTQLNGTAFTLNGATVTITPPFGMDAIFFAQTAASTLTLTSGTFALPDGSTPTTITLAPGEQVWLVGGITGATGLAVFVMTDTALQSPSTQYSQPASGATVASNAGFGHLTHVLDPSAAIASLTVTLPGSPRNGAKVTYVATQAVSAVTWAGGTLGVPKASFAAGDRLPLSYVGGQAKWY